MDTSNEEWDWLHRFNTFLKEHDLALDNEAINLKEDAVSFFRQGRRGSTNLAIAQTEKLFPPFKSLGSALGGNAQALEELQNLREQLINLHQEHERLKEETTNMRLEFTEYKQMRSITS
jgi:hypothetical protein